MKRGNRNSGAGWRAVHDAFLASIDAVAQSPEALRGASELGIDALLNTLLQEACRAARVKPEVYLEAMEEDDTLRDEIQEHVAELTARPEFADAQRQNRLRELERHLYVFRYIQSGETPPPWVWNALDSDERLRLQVARQDKEDADPVMLARVRNALSRAGTPRFGACEACGEPIRMERLQLLPWAERCVDCQRLHEGSSEPGSSSSPGQVEVVHF